MLHRFYETRIENCAVECDKLKRRGYHYGTLRLIVVIAAAVTLFLCRGEGWEVLSCLALAFVTLFILLVIRHNKVYARLDYVSGMLQLNTEELNALSHDFSAFDGAPELNDLQHPFASDLDIFGQHSIFQSINRTVIGAGKQRLAERFLEPLRGKDVILSTQEAVRELSQKTDFRQHFCVTGRLNGILEASEWLSRDDGIASQACNDVVRKEVRNDVVRNVFWHVMMAFVPVLWIVVIAACITGFTPVNILGWMFTFALIVAYIPQKRINKIYKHFDKTKKTIEAYSLLLQIVENEKFNSDITKRIQAKIISSNPKDNASQVIKRLSVILGALDQSFSFGGIFLNILILWNIRQLTNLERWNDANGERIGEWLGALAEIDALCSLGGFAYNHPDYVYPTISDSYFTFEAKDLGHPLIPADKCVRNDLSLSGSPDFVVVTGANMAGKSTFLRTAGVNFLLACMGAPVCAKSLAISPVQLFTSLRTADSLSSGESYFFAELKRLKMIIDRLQSGEQMFIILDEILKGTNSTDKQRGSLALMRQLTALGACGMIATHDLMLGELAEEFPQTIRNYCFEADIEGDALTFSYRIREGVARNMNASFLMKKMGITV
ncbi:MAG: DNA mismatch repair protein MutS [Tannerella sp.]|jgi:predicted ATPase|nr:DNA mismatch repair protein MutS [Tannerella sp.]